MLVLPSAQRVIVPVLRRGGIRVGRSRLVAGDPSEPSGCNTVVVDWDPADPGPDPPLVIVPTPGASPTEDLRRLRRCSSVSLSSPTLRGPVLPELLGPVELGPKSSVSPSSSSSFLSSSFAPSPSMAATSAEGGDVNLGADSLSIETLLLSTSAAAKILAYWLHSFHALVMFRYALSGNINDVKNSHLPLRTISMAFGTTLTVYALRTIVTSFSGITLFFWYPNTLL